MICERCHKLPAHHIAEVGIDGNIALCGACVGFSIRAEGLPWEFERTLVFPSHWDFPLPAFQFERAGEAERKRMGFGLPNFIIPGNFGFIQRRDMLD